MVMIKGGRCVMTQKVKEKPEEHVAPDGCRHYWIIESADGPTSKGVCRFCGVEKEFFNSFSGSIKDNSPS